MKAKIIIQTLAIFGATWVMVHWNDKPKMSNYKTEPPKVVLKSTFQVDTRLVRLGNQLGIPEAELQNCHASITETSKQVNVKDPISAFDPQTMTIMIFPKLLEKPEATQRLVLAHEYMHCVWHYQKPAQHAYWDGYLIRSYEANPDIKNRLKNYIDLGHDNLVDELHSYLCTEVSDNRLGADYLAYCSKYLPNRNALINNL